MKVEILSRELVKPYNSTLTSLRDYSLSLVDELTPPMNIPAILYYSNDNHSSSKENATSSSRCKHLKRSLSKVLTRFYPFAGRYLKDRFMVDCGDQGAEFVEARVDVRLDDLIGQVKNLKAELLNCLLPRSIVAGDEVSTDPLLAVQVSYFVCGGWAIGVLSSHRIADMSTISTFINEWAIDAKLLLEGFDENHDFPIMSPSWNSASLFPGKKLSGLPLGLSGVKENIEHPKIVTKVFFFNNCAISRISEKARLDNSSERLPTRVQSVFGIIGKAIIDIHVANHGNSKEFLVVQPVNMRERTDPPIPKNQCGNFYLVSAAQIAAGKRGVELQSIVDLLMRSVKKEVERCKMILSVGGEMMITNSFDGLTKTPAKPEISSVLAFTDWCKFPFYEADFGLGKPVWVSGINSPMGNNVYLFSDKFGEGIEAWVNLNANDMHKFEQDSNIMEFSI